MFLYMLPSSPRVWRGCLHPSPWAGVASGSAAENSEAPLELPQAGRCAGSGAAFLIGAQLYKMPLLGDCGQVGGGTFYHAMGGCRLPCPTPTTTQKVHFVRWHVRSTPPSNCTKTRLLCRPLLSARAPNNAAKKKHIAIYRDLFLDIC